MPPVATTSLKLEFELKERVQRLASARRRSAHWIMREAVEQYVGRVGRVLPGKTAIEVHDYHDHLHPLLRRMHARRLVAFKALGFTPAAPR